MQSVSQHIQIHPLLYAKQSSCCSTNLSINRSVQQHTNLQDNTCPHLQLDHDPITIYPHWDVVSIAIGRIQLEIDRHYLHVRYECSRNIYPCSLILVLAHLASLYQCFPQVKNPRVHIGHHSRDTEQESKVLFSKSSVDARYPNQIAICTIAIRSGLV